MGDQCHTSDDRDEEDVDDVDVDVDNSDVDYNDYYDDGRLVDRRPGDVATCFASADKVLLLSSSLLLPPLPSSSSSQL